MINRDNVKLFVSFVVSSGTMITNLIPVVVIKASNKYHLIVRGLFKNFKTPTNNKLLRHMLLVGVLKFLNKPLTTGSICLTLLLLLV